MSDFKLIVGLGNPGKCYENTRHNVGFRVIERLARRCGATLENTKFNSILDNAELFDKKLILAKPQLFMNRSGIAVAKIFGFYKMDLTDILIVADDLALEPGKIRLRACGSAGGHNGLKDIIEKLGSQNFPRLRVGIGKSIYPDSADYVLANFTQEQQEPIDAAIAKSLDCIESWLKDGIDKTMTEFNV